MIRPVLIALAALPLVAGCAQQGDFPSLLPRPVEQLSTDEPVRPDPMVAPDPALDAEIDRLLSLARKGSADFEAALPSARSSVGAAGTRESESWVVAQQALSRLEAARGETVTALGDLDRLALRRAALPTNAGQYRALLDAVETAERLARAQQAEIDQLRARLS